MMNKRAARADIFLLITAALWGFGFVAQSSGMDYVGPFTYNALRFPLGSLSLLPLLFLFRRKAKNANIDVNMAASARPKKTAILRMTLLAGTVLFIAVVFQQIGMIFTTVGNAGFITGFYVVLTPVFGIFIGKKTGIPTWVGMVFALTGLYFISAAGNFNSINPGDCIILAGAAFWAVHILVIDHLVQKMDPLILSAGQFAWCGFFSIIAAFAVEPFVGSWAARIAPDYALQQWVTLPDLLRLIGTSAAAVNGAIPDAAAHGAAITGTALLGAAVPILYGGLVSAGIAYTLQIVAQKDAPPAHATIILCLEGPFATLGGILLRNEKPGPFTLLGFGFMLFAMFITQWDVIRGGLKNQ
ncbi:MAG: DMT family transporter [Spirochaetaceae bacterium]|jgi:drug/metabolite transporter (DMT)-like permease|nr:DMT family transporter [Spirochaetaceae bacterium]